MAGNVSSHWSKTDIAMYFGGFQLILVVSKADHQTTKYSSRPNYFLMGESVHVCKGTCIAVAIITLK